MEISDKKAKQKTLLLIAYFRYQQNINNINSQKMNEKNKFFWKIAQKKKKKTDFFLEKFFSPIFKTSFI